MPSTIQLAGLVAERALVDVLASRIEPTGSARTNSRRGDCFGEAARQAGHGAGAAAAEHDRVELPTSSICCQISGPVPCSCARRVVRVAELVDEVRARRFAARGARPCPGSTRGGPWPRPSASAPPRAPIALRLKIFSRLILSGTTSTSL